MTCRIQTEGPLRVLITVVGTGQSISQPDGGDRVEDRPYGRPPTRRVSERTSSGTTSPRALQFGKILRVGRPTERNRWGVRYERLSEIPFGQRQGHVEEVFWKVSVRYPESKSEYPSDNAETIEEIEGIEVSREGGLGQRICEITDPLDRDLQS